MLTNNCTARAVAHRLGFAVLVLAAVVMTGAAPHGVTTGAAQPAVVHQLRIYEIFDGNKQLFHERFRDHAMRIMARYDFKILSMWETRHAGRTEFAYLLEWPNEDVMKTAWIRFLNDKEWGDIKQASRAHGALVGEIQDRTLHMTDYSPRRLVAPGR